MEHSFQQSMCNEAFEGWNFAEACRTIRKTGYAGIEIAPFTLSSDPASIPADKRREYRDIIASEGLIFAGLHWLMVAPKGMHVTTPDAELRKRSWELIHSLIDLCADLGDHAVMVFGSPFQRGTTGGSTREEATRRFVDGLAEAAPHACGRGVTILVEALPTQQCDVVNSLDAAAAIVREIGQPSIRTMFDTHNAINETEPHDVLVDRYFDLIRHVHINEMDGRHPGTGDYDFKPVFRTLARRAYTGWISLEAFDFKPGAERIANESLRYVESQLGQL